MKKTNALLLVIMIFCSIAAFAEEEATEVSDRALEAILERGELTVVGKGIGDEGSEAERRAAAEEAAIAFGQVRLAQILGGVIVDGDTTVAKRKLVSQKFKLAVERFRVKYAEQVGETEFKNFADGSVEAKVTMSIPLKPFRRVLKTFKDKELEKKTPKLVHTTTEETKTIREYTKLTIKKEKEKTKERREETVSQKVKETVQKVEKRAKKLVQERPKVRKKLQKGPFTGLIIIGTGLGVRPSTCPKIYSKSGKEVYGYINVVDDIWLNYGMAAYAKNEAQARNIFKKRVGKNPLVVKAIGARGVNQTDVVVTNDNATAIFAADMKTHFLEKARVVFVNR